MHDACGQEGDLSKSGGGIVSYLVGEEEISFRKKQGALLQQSKLLPSGLNFVLRWNSWNQYMALEPKILIWDPCEWKTHPQTH